jgi:hypothetical protein
MPREAPVTSALRRAIANLLSVLHRPILGSANGLFH